MIRATKSSTPTHTVLLPKVGTKLWGLECESNWPY